MKKHIFSDKSVAYFFEIGDKIKFVENGKFLYSDYRKNGIGTIIEICWRTRQFEKPYRPILTNLIDFVWVKTKVDSKYGKYWTTLKLPVWKLKPFNKRRKIENIFLEDKRLK